MIPRNCKTTVRYGMWTSTTGSRSLCLSNQSVSLKLPFCHSASCYTPTSFAFFVWNSEISKGYNKKYGVKHFKEF